MPKNFCFAIVERSQLRQIAFRIRTRMWELRMSQQQLANRCSKVIEQSPDGESGFYIRRERIAKILMNCQKKPGTSVAKTVTWKELQVLARALETSPEWLTGMGELPDPILWDALAHSRRAEEILHLMNYHEEQSQETLVWAEGLMCSFMTPDFLRAYHEALFTELEVIGQRERKQKLVEVYDRISEARRNRRVNGEGPRGQFTQLILRSDLERIIRGTGQYRWISRPVRRRCLENVRGLLDKAWGRIALVVVEDERVGELVGTLRGFNSIGACVAPRGEMFALLRTRMGDVLWSENRDYVGRYVHLLETLRQRAAYRDRDGVLRLLDDLLVPLR